MSPISIGIIAFAAFFLLLAVGIPIAIAAGVVGLIGLVAIAGLDKAFYFLRTIPYAEVSIYEFTVLPLFIIMGNFFEGGGFVKALFSTAQKWVGKIPGGLAIGTVLGGAAFAAASGSSVASSAILGKVCVPEMEKYGYNSGFGAAVCAVSACLAVMIPPSVLMILYGVITEVSIGKLLIAGFFPGIVLAILYILTVFIWVLIDPSLAPKFKQQVTWLERFSSLKNLWGIMLVVFIIMGGLYSGIITPTEAGAAGAFCALVMGLANRHLTLKYIWAALLDAGKNTSFVLFIIVGVMIFTRFLALGQVPSELGRFLVSLEIPPLGILAMIIFVYLILGMFMSAPAMLILTLPIFFPTITMLNFDPILFGVIVVLMCEIAVLTPPVGINVFVVKGVVPKASLEDIFKKVTPFVIVNFVALILFIAFPQIALFLPGLMAR